MMRTPLASRSPASSLGKALPICLLAFAAAAFLFLGTAWGQEGTERAYVDLVMSYEQGPSARYHSHVAYRVKNTGTASAIGVTVSFLLKDLEAVDDDLSGLGITDKRTENSTNQSFTWEVGTVPPGETRQTLFRTRLHSGHSSPGPVGVITATASSITPEPGMLLANNTIKAYSFARSGGIAISEHISGAGLTLLLSVDDLRPEAEGDVNFGLTVLNRGGGGTTGFINLIADASVKVELSRGLRFKEVWTPPATFVKSSSQSATWFPPDTDTHRHTPRPVSQEIEIETQLTSDTLADIPLEGRCVTAWVEDSTPPPSPGNVFGRLEQCLGDDPKVVFKDGEIDLLYLHPCATASTVTYPCRDADGNNAADNGLELVVHAFIRHQPVLRRSSLGRSDFKGIARGNDYILLRPENIIVHVAPETRVGTKWYTGSDENTDDNDAGIIPGVVAHLDFLGAAWKPYTFAISDVSPKKRPGSFALRRMDAKTFAILDVDTKKSLGPIDSAVDVIPIIGAFGTLGTYEVNITITGTHSSTGYPSTGTYTFHVGPIAELEVQGGGRSPTVPAGQRAFTIVAVNHGPDDAPAAQVTVTGLDAGGYVSHTATAGSFDPNTGVWTIGELITKDVSQATRGRDGEVLTIITGAAVDTEITAAISNTQDYRVCIDSSGDDVDAADESACTGTSGNTWHTTEYYDYIGDNNSATIRAGEGTGADLPAIRTVEAVGPAAIEIIWYPVTEVNGRPVTHYEVQRSASPWTPVADVTGTRYVDTAIRAGESPQYRVRAVNEWGQAGPWSMPTLTGPDAPGDFTAEQLRDGEVRLTWTRPDGNGADVTGYTIQVSTDGGQSWGNTGASLGADDTSWVHRNLSVGPVRLYRIRASTARGHGPWTQATSASIAAPTLSAYYSGPSEIELTWTMPAGNAVPVLSWELQYSPDGSSWNRLATVQAGDGMAYTDRGLSPGAFRHYRVRASTALGHGPWSEAATATTAAGVPGNFRAQANGPNEIVLSWNKPSGDAEIWEYQVQRKTEGVDWSLLAVVYPEQGTSYVDSDLSAGGTWSYRVRAISIADGNLLEGNWSAEASATTDSDGPANAPTGLNATPNGENAIVLSWTAPAAGGGSVTGYRIEHSSDGVKWERLATLGNVTTYSHTGLMPGTTHYYRVAALSGGNAGPFSSEASASTAGSPTTVPGMPTNLRVTGVDRDRVSIAWGPPENDGGARVTGYEYQYVGPCAANPADLCFSGLRSAGGTSASVSGLAAGEYTFEVRALNAVGAGQWSDTVWATVVPESRGRVIVTPDSLTVTEGGSATYRVKLSHEPIQPIQLGLFWDDPGEDLSLALAGYQGMLLLPSNYAPPEGALWDGWAYRWNVGIPITVEAVEDDDTGDGTVVIHHDVWTAPADLLGNPPDWAEDPVYHFMTGPAVIVAVRDND